jgi:nucleoside-diphosphate-sugar epimerase
MSRVLVTGATGLVGQSLCELLARQGFAVRAALRTARGLPACIAEGVVVGEIGPDTNWRAALEDVEFVVHLAARVHQPSQRALDPQVYDRINAYGTQRLATAAAAAGVRRLVYVSSVKVNGDGMGDHAYCAADPPDPQDAYARSKWLAEKLLLEGRDAAHSVALVRPPLVYGPGVRANFLRLLDWVYRGRMLPLASVRNRRSLVSVWNLADLLVRLLTQPEAVGRLWMVSDGDDLSTPDLVRELAAAMQKPPHLIPVPPSLLQVAGRLTGRVGEVQRLCGSLRIDISQTRSALQWVPPLSAREGLARTVDWYLSARR